MIARHARDLINDYRQEHSFNFYPIRENYKATAPYSAQLYTKYAFTCTIWLLFGQTPQKGIGAESQNGEKAGAHREDGASSR